MKFLRQKRVSIARSRYCCDRKVQVNGASLKSHYVKQKAIDKCCIEGALLIKAHNALYCSILCDL